MSNKANGGGMVPKLRFPEFRDAPEWEEKSMGGIARKFMDGDWIESKDQSASGVRLIQTGNIGIGEFIPKTENARFISEETFKRLRCTEVLPGDCLISRLPDPAGRSCLMPNIGQKMITAVDCTVVRFDENQAIPYFVILFSQTDRYFTKVDAQCSGSTRQRISRENLSRLLVPLPKIPEQQKIADCLSSLDELIAAQIQKLDTLKTHKKGLMQQLFPAEGETVPKLRFPEFRNAEEWEAKPLGTVCEMQAGKFVAASEISEKQEDGFYPCFGGNGLRGYTKTYNQSGRYSLIGRQGALCGNVNLVEGDFYATEHALVTTPKAGNSTDWLFYKLCFLNLNQFATGQAQPGLSVEVLEKVACVVPKDAGEQQKIADCLSSLDELIAAQIQKLDTLKTHKKGLMQQLFPVTPTPDSNGL
jgi:type I restriction enzyme S subunit